MFLPTLDHLVKYSILCTFQVPRLYDPLERKSCFNYFIYQMLVWIIDIRKQRRRKRAHNAKKFASSTGGNLVAKQAATVATTTTATEDHTEVSMPSDAEYGRAELTGSKFYTFWS